MSKKNKKICLPLEAINYYKSRMSDIYSKIEEYESKLNPFLSQGARLNNIFSGIYAIVANDFIEHEKELITRINNTEMVKEIIYDQAKELYILYLWRKSKAIFTFSNEMKNILFEQADEECAVPTNIANLLPYDAFYVKIADEEIDGFYVTKICDESNTQKSAIMIAATRRVTGETSNDVDYEMYLLKNDENITIRQYIDKLEAQEKKYMQEKLGSLAGAITENRKMKYSTAVKYYIQLLLYIISSNADIKENHEQKRIYKRGPVILDKYEEIKKWDVGEEITRVIKLQKQHDRKYKDKYEKSVIMSSTKRPHVRASHWHHYWTGPKDSNNRKLIIKWLAPMYINLNESSVDKLPIINTVYKV